ncbi:type VII toxin-antitoxin system MntA family adenylyltransferase antitoxin [Natronorubrum tibetense]|uniref:Nucleotidyltransferase protein n=1 Tax=Natronorubrum tibetense GA33 TaxID=1114856 RepID=L9VKN7_9EURY|nr:nucleotidyltransferase domain-containing protein [Natronorubrum tibetense]ELY37709.1 nucleotidyltransferase protein [Natronorubrum tibetense GA33]
MKRSEDATLDDAVPLETAQAVLREHDVRVGLLFGSHATGDAHARSDIDIAVVLDDVRPGDPDYNDVFLGLSADLSDTLGTDDIDLVDLRTAPPELVAAVFDRGVVLVGDSEDAAALRTELTETASDDRSPRERFDAAITKIDAHLGSAAITATDGETRDR